MGECEIRILRHDGTLAMIVVQTQHGDIAAIRSARQIARDKKFEVWRDAQRIYPAAGLPDYHEDTD
jgi:hypothetical protein